ncbi:MAG: amidohydrolase family protein [Burkholderiales bacterium]
MARLVLQGCLALLGAAAEASNEAVDIVVDGGRIAAINATGAVAHQGEVINARGMLATAGLINGHQHSHEHFQKGRFANLPLEMWMNYVRPPKPLLLNERQVYLRTLVGAIEALTSGTTTLIDDLNIGGVPDSTHLAAAYRAYEDIGIRALVGISMMDRPFFESVPFVDEEFDPSLLAEMRALPKPDAEALLALCRDLAQRRHPDRNRVGFIVAPSAPQRCSENFLKAARSIADAYDLPIMIHVQETRLQAVTALRTYGSTMVEYLHRIGFLGAKTTLIHGVWLTPREIDLLAASGTTVQHNPWSNLRLGSGIAPLRALLDAGVNVSLGSDGCGSTDTCNMLNVVGTASVLHTVRGDDYTRWPQAADVWRAGTLGGAIAIGRGDELGTLGEGKFADLVLYRLDGIPFVPLNNPLRQLVSAERGANIALVMVNGEVVVRDGDLTRIDRSAILAEIREEHARLAPLLDEAERSAERLRPSMHRIYERCLREQVASGIVPARLPL